MRKEISMTKFEAASVATLVRKIRLDPAGDMLSQLQVHLPDCDWGYDGGEICANVNGAAEFDKPWPIAALSVGAIITVVIVCLALAMGWIT